MEENCSPNMDDKHQPNKEDVEKSGCGVQDDDSGTKDKVLDDDDQRTPVDMVEDTNGGDERDEGIGDNYQSNSLIKDVESNIQRTSEEESQKHAHDFGENDGGGGDGGGDADAGIGGGAGVESTEDVNISNISGDSPSSKMDNIHQESKDMKEVDHHAHVDNHDDNQDKGKGNSNLSQTNAESDHCDDCLKDNGAGDNVGETNKSNQAEDSSQLNKGGSINDEDEKLDKSSENTTDYGKHVLTNQSLPPTIHDEDPGDINGGIAGGNKGGFSNLKRSGGTKKKLQVSASLDTGLQEPPLLEPLFYEKSRRIGLSENSNPAFHSPRRIPNGAVHALKEIAKVTKHGAKDNIIQNRQVMSVKTKHYPDRSAQKLLRERRDRVIESLMRKEGQRKDAPYTYGKFSPIKTDKLPEFRGTGGTRGGPKKLPLFNLMNEPFNVATNKRTLERRRLRLSREIAALDMLPEGNIIQPDQLLKPVEKDANRGVTTTARSSLLGKVRERKLRSETKKELLLRRRKTPRISDYNKYTLELSSTGYRPKRTVPKVLPKLGHCIKKDGSEKKDEKGIENEEDNGKDQPKKNGSKHVSFGPICILNIDEEFAMFMQANRKSFKNAYRAKLRRQQATDNGFAGGKFGQLSPVRKQAKSTITDKTFSTEKKEVPQFTAKPVSTLPKIGQSKADNKASDRKDTEKYVPIPGEGDDVPKTQAMPEKKPNKSILKIAKYQPPDVTLNVKCSPEFRAIMDSLHGVNPSPFLLK